MPQVLIPKIEYTGQFPISPVTKRHNSDQAPPGLRPDENQRQQDKAKHNAQPTIHGSFIFGHYTLLMNKMPKTSFGKLVWQ